MAWGSCEVGTVGWVGALPWGCGRQQPIRPPDPAFCLLVEVSTSEKPNGCPTMVSRLRLVCVRLSSFNFLGLSWPYLLFFFGQFKTNSKETRKLALVKGEMDRWVSQDRIQEKSSYVADASPRDSLRAAQGSAVLFSHMSFRQPLLPGPGHHLQSSPSFLVTFSDGSVFSR